LTSFGARDCFFGSPAFSPSFPVCTTHRRPLDRTFWVSPERRPFFSYYGHNGVGRSSFPLSLFRPPYRSRQPFRWRLYCPLTVVHASLFPTSLCISPFLFLFLPCRHCFLLLFSTSSFFLSISGHLYFFCDPALFAHAGAGRCFPFLFTTFLSSGAPEGRFCGPPLPFCRFHPLHHISVCHLVGQPTTFPHQCGGRRFSQVFPSQALSPIQ